MVHVYHMEMTLKTPLTSAFIHEQNLMLNRFIAIVDFHNFKFFVVN